MRDETRMNGIFWYGVRGFGVAGVVGGAVERERRVR